MRGIQAFSRLVLLAAVLAALSMASMIVPTPAQAATAGINGWYWPTGASSFDMSPWWHFRGDRWHVAQDMRSPKGSAVYAVADGVVLESKYVRGYGPGGTLGGAVVILHRDYQGNYFKALYGHVYGLRYAKGAKVKAGAVIARVNGSSPPHVHFGIHPGVKYPSDNNPFRGHTYTRRNTYGFVDPVKYLKTHFRNDPYSAPVIPTVGSIETTGPVTWTRASSGTLYWGAAESTWSCTLPNGEPVQASAEATIPAHDATRYTLSISGSTSGTVTVKDVLPRLTLRTSNATPTAGASITLSGSVKNAADEAFAYPPIYVERWTGSGWVRVVKVYGGLTGCWSTSTRVTAPTKYRARFAPPSSYSRAASATTSVNIR